MSKRIMLIDDDLAITSMLKGIINSNDLGKVISELHSSKNAVEEVLFLDPDILIIDFLLPEMDGVQVINSLKSSGFKGKIIMVSQVEDEAMRATAYLSGIEIFISKPLNSIEVVTVLQKTIHTMNLEAAMSHIKSVIGDSKAEQKIGAKDEIQEIFSEIGLAKESDRQDVMKVIRKIMAFQQDNRGESYRLSDIYEDIAGPGTSAKAFEQKIRRIIGRVFSNMASMGYNDLYNPIFLKYSHVIFNYAQLRKEISFIENGKGDHGKVSNKKFFEGIISKLS